MHRQSIDGLGSKRHMSVLVHLKLALFIYMVNLTGLPNRKSINGNFSIGHVAC